MPGEFKVELAGTVDDILKHFQEDDKKCTVYQILNASILGHVYNYLVSNHKSYQYTDPDYYLVEERIMNDRSMATRFLHEYLYKVFTVFRPSAHPSLVYIEEATPLSLDLENSTPLSGVESIAQNNVFEKESLFTMWSMEINNVALTEALYEYFTILSDLFCFSNTGVYETYVKSANAIVDSCPGVYQFDGICLTALIPGTDLQVPFLSVHQLDFQNKVNVLKYFKFMEENQSPVDRSIYAQELCARTRRPAKL